MCAEFFRALVNDCMILQESGVRSQEVGTLHATSLRSQELGVVGAISVPECSSDRESPVQEARR